MQYYFIITILLFDVTLFFHFRLHFASHVYSTITSYSAKHNLYTNKRKLLKELIEASPKFPSNASLWITEATETIAQNVNLHRSL